MGLGNPPPPPPQLPNPVVTSDVHEVEARLQHAISSNAKAVLNELTQTNKNHTALIVQMACLEAQVASSKAELDLANRELNQTQAQVASLKAELDLTNRKLDDKRNEVSPSK